MQLTNSDKFVESDFACVSRDYIIRTHEWNEITAFSAPHLVEEIEGCYIESSQWHVKEKLKTVSVALIICLNVDVDPPDIIKPSPCARMHCWLNPTGKNPTKAIDEVGNLLQMQYARWQSKARYKTLLDPTVEDVKKLTTGLRRVSRDDRVLFHYNGHGVPKPTKNGELWVFNKNYTQYIPLSIVDLQMWVGAPSVFVYDCHNAGIIVEKFEEFCAKRMLEMEASTLIASESLDHASLDMSSSPKGGMISAAHFPESAGPPHTQLRIENCIQLAACGADETLPLDADLPADIFTSCLTTPVKMAMRFHYINNKSNLPAQLDYEMLDKMPGTFAQRLSMVGELNWIFTAITDSIAWNLLPRDLFTRLFRQDLLVASLFRNFLLAQRVLRAYGCQPVSVPRLPDTTHHHLWAVWDYVCDLFLRQLPDVVAQLELQRQVPVSAGLKETTMASAAATVGFHNFCHSNFFADQLQAFDVWLSGTCGARDKIAEQLPVVLQVLLSQQLRSRALELLSRFLDLGGWAVSQALQVGIFPYVLRLLQSTTRELQPLLVFVWCKIIAFDNSESVASELVKDCSFKYFMLVLTDPQALVPYKAMSAFVLARLLDVSKEAQELGLAENLIPLLLEVLEDFGAVGGSPTTSANKAPSQPTAAAAALSHDFHTRLISGVIDARRCRQFLIFCLAKLWCKSDTARWFGVRNNAHERLYPFLDDPAPEVRAATVYALGTFMDNSDGERSDHANAVDHSVGCKVVHCAQDACPLVRRELVAALAGLVEQFEAKFVTVAFQHMEEERLRQQFDATTSSTASSSTSATITTCVNSVVVATTPVATGRHRSVDISSAAAARPLPPIHKVSTSPCITASFGNSSQQQQPSTQCSLDIDNSSSMLTNKRRSSALLTEMSSTCSGAAAASLFRINSSSSINKMVGVNGNFYSRLWAIITSLSHDTHPGVANSAKVVMSKIRQKILQKVKVYNKEDSGTDASRGVSAGSHMRRLSSRSPQPKRSSSSDNTMVRSAPGSPTNSYRPTNSSPGTKRQPRHSPSRIAGTRLLAGYPHSIQYANVSRKMFGGDGPTAAHVATTSNGDEHDRSMLTSRSPSPSLSNSSATLEDLPLPQVKTEFFEWSCRSFTKPLTRLPAEKDANSALTLRREYRALRCHEARCTALKQLVSIRAAMMYAQSADQQGDSMIRKCSRMKSECDLNAPPPCISVVNFSVQTQHQPHLVQLHSFEPHLCVADRHGVSVYDTTTGRSLRYLAPLRPWQENSRLTCMLFVNEIQEPSLLLTGASDGTVRVWRNYYPYLGGSQELATAFLGLPMQRGSGSSRMVAHWEANSQHLALGGHCSLIRVWDVTAEQPLMDMTMGADHSTTCVSQCDSLLASGCANGWLRCVDVREAPSERHVIKHHVDARGVLAMALQPHCPGGPRLVTVGLQGRVSLFDLRCINEKPISSFETLQRQIQSAANNVNATEYLAPSLTVAAVHSLSPLLVSGQNRNGVHFHDLPSGNSIGRIQYVNNYEDTRMGRPIAFHFHPLKAQLAVAYADHFSSNNVSVFSSDSLANEAYAAAEASAAAKM